MWGEVCICVTLLFFDPDDIQTELGKKGATSVALTSLLAANEDKEQKVRAARLLLNLAFIGTLPWA